MAIVLIRKTGFAWSSNPYGITDPKGNPCCLRESVERLPTRFRYTKVRARSANVGSAIAGWLPAAVEPACFPAVDEDIPALPHGFDAGSEILLLPDPWKQANTLRLEMSVQSAEGIRTSGEKGERRSVYLTSASSTAST